MIWKQKPDLSTLNQLCKDTLVTHLGIIMEEIGPDYIQASMPVDHRTIQPDGILHGGATAALAETLGSIASYLMLDDPKSKRVAGIDLQISHLSPATTGSATAIVKAVKTGKNIHFWNIDVLDANQKRIAQAKLTVMVIHRDK